MRPGMIRSRVSALAATLLFGAALPALPQSAPAPTRTPAVRSPGNAEWAHSLPDALTRAAAEKKLVFVEFGQSGCGNCQRMDALLYPAFDFEALLIDMVPVKLDLDTPDGRATAQKYEIQEVPSVLVTSPEGRLVFLMQGFQNAPEFYAHVRRDVDAYRAFARTIDAQNVAALPAADALQSGRDLYHRRDPGSALARFQRVAAAPDATAPQRDEALELQAVCDLDLGRPVESRTAIEKLLATTKDPDRRERAEIFRAQIPLSEGKRDEALRLFQDFQKTHPNSRYKSGVAQLIQKLETQKP
jgi:tetratricopeptide (TPR) repeat protein